MACLVIHPYVRREGADVGTFCVVLAVLRSASSRPRSSATRFLLMACVLAFGNGHGDGGVSPSSSLAVGPALLSRAARALSLRFLLASHWGITLEVIGG